jgi:restriction endonuclease S subunit
VDSLIGVVPDDWVQSQLGEICDILAGPAIAKASLAEPGSADIPVITPGDLRHNRVADDYTIGVSPETARKLSHYRLLPDDIVCARTGHLGRHAVVKASQQGWLIGSSCLRLRVHLMINARYLVYYLGHPVVCDWIIRNAGGSIIPTLSTKMLGSLPVVLPATASQSSIADILGALDDKIIVHEQISNATATLRDAVLLRLLTGADQAAEAPNA